MSEQIYSQDEICAAVLPLLKKYRAASDIDLIVVGGKDFDLTDVLCIAEELHCALDKPVDVYELREIDTQSAFYDTILAEGVQIA